MVKGSCTFCVAQFGNHSQLTSPPHLIQSDKNSTGLECTRALYITTTSIIHGQDTML